MHEVFEHIPDPDAVFAKVRELLHPGGVFMLSTPNGERLINRLRVRFGKAPLLLDPTHVKEYSLADLTEAKPGFELVACTGNQLIDSYTLQLLLGMGFGPLVHRLGGFARLLTDNRPMFFMGHRWPAISYGLWAMYRKVNS
jgi:SAM-dependent methyltransferase